MSSKLAPGEVSTPTDYGDAERLAVKEQFESLLDQGQALEAIRMGVATPHFWGDDMSRYVFKRLFDLVEAAATEEEYDRLNAEIDRVEQWRGF